LGVFIRVYELKYSSAIECLKNDREALRVFYDFPAEHWIHTGTANPIKSTFVIARLRTAKTRGCVSRGSILLLAFKLPRSAENRWLKVRGSELISWVIRGIPYSKSELKYRANTTLTISQPAWHGRGVNVSCLE